MNNSAFDEMARIIGKERAEKLIRLMPGRVVRIRKKHVHIAQAYLRDERLLSMPLLAVIKILSCTRRYAQLLRSRREG